MYFVILMLSNKAQIHKERIWQRACPQLPVERSASPSIGCDLHSQLWLLPSASCWCSPWEVCVPATWLPACPGPALAITGIWEVSEQQIRDLLLALLAHPTLFSPHLLFTLLK